MAGKLKVANCWKTASIDTARYFSYDVRVMQLEQLVLTAILSLRDNAYGVTIHQKVQELAAPKTVSAGAVYVTLDRLEDKGMVASWLSDPTPERGGRSKRYYRLEALGERALEESAETAKRLLDAFTEALGEIGKPKRPKWQPTRPR